MKLTTSNVVTGNISVSRLTIGNTAVVESLNLGNVNFTPSAVTVGNVSITPAAISTPSLIVGGVSYTGGVWGGILNYQEFTSSGTWNNPYANAAANASLTGNEQVFVMAWGGGGGGAANSTVNRGGGGGACVLGYYTLSQLANAVPVVVGAGGVSNGTTGVAFTGVTAGGTTTFANSTTGGQLIAYGGGIPDTNNGGGGGGTLAAGGTGTGGAPLGGAAGNPAGTSTFGGGGGGTVTNALTGQSIFGGGGGARSANGGLSIYGGGGGGSGPSSVPGNSVFGGVGASGGSAAAAPGGGGGGNSSPIVAYNGARGEVRVWVFGTAGTTLGAPTYTLTANTTTLYEGSSVLYTITTTNVANNSTLYYTLNNSSTATSADFTTAVNGAVIISGGTGTFTLTANNDTDSANEAFQIDVRTSNSSGTIVASNGSFSIIPITDYSLSNVSFVASFTTNSTDIGTLRGVWVDPSGTRMYIVGRTPSRYIVQYSLSTPFDVTTASYVARVAGDAGSTGPTDIYITPDGTKLFESGSGYDGVVERAFGTAWDITTLGAAGTKLTFKNMSSVSFNSDGTLLIGGSGDNISGGWNLSTPYSLATASAISTVVATETGISLSGDGLKYFASVSGSGVGAVAEYSLSVAASPSTRSLVRTVNLATISGDASLASVSGMFVSTIATNNLEKNKHMFVVDSTSQKIWQFLIS